MESTAIELEMRSQALLALACADVDGKVRMALNLSGTADPAFVAGEQDANLRASLPGRPTRPTLTHPAKVPKRSPLSLDGRAALVHAIAHIEFNAINLALDAIWRFDNMPSPFYTDWALVAREEAQHFSLLRQHLRGLEKINGLSRWDYGSFEAHDNLWAMCQDTSQDVVARMALVPRTLEARGLDATPLIQAKLRQVGTPDAMEAVNILDTILRDEVGHVAIGNHWYQWLCAREQLDPIKHYEVLTERYKAPRLKPPFNLAARRRAGFRPQELMHLQAYGSPDR